MKQPVEYDSSIAATKSEEKQQQTKNSILLTYVEQKDCGI